MIVELRSLCVTTPRTWSMGQWEDFFNQSAVDKFWSKGEYAQKVRGQDKFIRKKLIL